MARTKKPGEVKTQGRSKTRNSFHFRPKDEEENRERIAMIFPVKRLTDFTQDEIAQMEEMYRPTKAPTEFCLDDVIKFGTYMHKTVVYIIKQDPAWLVWATHSIRNFRLSVKAQRRLRNKCPEEM